MYMFVLSFVASAELKILFVTGFCICSFFCQKFMVGLNFANDQEANHFGNAVDTKIRERTEKRICT